MRSITHLVIHTAAAPGGVDQTVESIRAYHKRKGWSDIGYHFVIRKDGSLHKGRPVERAGAGVEGFNKGTIHVCCTGHGDLEDFTEAQKRTLVKLCVDLLHTHRIVGPFILNPKRILGHRECYALPDVPNTGKTCPGTKVDMRSIRLAVMSQVTD